MNKFELRQKYRLKRQALNQEECNALSKLILNKLVTSFDLKNLNVGIFLPIERQKEPNTFLLFSMIDKSITNLYAPKVIPNKEEMIFNRINSPDEILLGMYNIPEPLSTEQIDCRELNIILIPLMAFSGEGYRVGYGKGYYDKYLHEADKKLIKIGISMFDNTEEIDDVNKFDIKMDYCITPSKMYTFKN
jgi:5-formyltetrahydrofolate cyclo-ligase